MSAEAQIDAAVQKAKLEIASRMLRAAFEVQQEHIRRVGKPAVKIGKTYTVSSLPGEYPRKRTGEGQKGIVYGPTTAEGIVAGGMIVRIGQTTASKHMLFLEFGRYMALGVWIKFNRLGWQRTAKDMAARVRAIITRKG